MVNEGRLSRSAGEVRSRSLSIGTGGRLELDGGELNVGRLGVGPDDSPSLAIVDPSTTVTVTERFWVRHGGRLEAEPGSAIHLRGSELYLEGPQENLAGLSNIEPVFSGVNDNMPLGEMRCEAVSPDEGVYYSDYAEAIVLPGMTVGLEERPGYVRLIDSWENADSLLPEVLVVDRLTLGPGSTLDLNGLGVYYRSFENLGGEVIGEGFMKELIVPLMGDLNGDGAFNGLDIPALKEALFLGAKMFEWEYGIDANRVADFNGDGRFTGLDIPGFKVALAGPGGGAATVPEPGTLSLFVGLAIAAIGRRVRRGLD